MNFSALAAALEAAVPGGGLRLLETWGSDEGIVSTARMTTGGDFRGWETPEAPGDERLLRHLLKHRHSGPFEFAGATIEVRAPLFVVAQWQRHRTQSYSQASLRFASVDADASDLVWFPPRSRLCPPVETGNKQARGGPVVVHATKEGLRSVYGQAVDAVLWAYGEMVDAGVPFEVSRAILPFGTMTRFRATANLLNWFRFLDLRTPTDAQEEIRVYAALLEELLATKFPRTMAARAKVGRV